MKRDRCRRPHLRASTRSAVTGVVQAAWHIPKSRAALIFAVVDSTYSTRRGLGMKFGVLIFPGSNCDHDAYWTIQQVAKQPVTFLWHESHDLENCDAIIVPGGFAFGDYLRTGAIAKFSPVMESVKKFADGGGIVLGICNGFQILCESGLLPGRSDAQCGPEVHLQACPGARRKHRHAFHQACREGEVLTIPIGHMEGNYFCDEATLAELQRDKRIVFRYSTPDGQITRRKPIPTDRSTTLRESAVPAATCSA